MHEHFYLEQNIYLDSKYKKQMYHLTITVINYMCPIF